MYSAIYFLRPYEASYFFEVKPHLLDAVFNKNNFMNRPLVGAPERPIGHYYDKNLENHRCVQTVFNERASRGSSR